MLWWCRALLKLVLGTKAKGGRDRSDGICPESEFVNGSNNGSNSSIEERRPKMASTLACCFFDCSVSFLSFFLLFRGGRLVCTVLVG